MPHKRNDDRRHHIQVRNRPEYEAGLRRRGSLTLSIEDAALEHWQTVGPGGEARCSDAAIQTTLMVRAAFRLAFRQTEGLMASEWCAECRIATLGGVIRVAEQMPAMPISA